MLLVTFDELLLAVIPLLGARIKNKGNGLGSSFDKLEVNKRINSLE